MTEPTTLQIDKISSLVLEGRTLSEAAASSGVASSLALAWRDKGEDDALAGESNRFVEFTISVARAEANFIDTIEREAYEVDAKAAKLRALDNSYRRRDANEKRIIEKLGRDKDATALKGLMGTLKVKADVLG